MGSVVFWNVGVKRGKGENGNGISFVASGFVTSVLWIHCNKSGTPLFPVLSSLYCHRYC